MDDSARTCADIINGEMQKALLRLFVSAYQSALVVEFGEVGGIQFTERSVCWCHQPTVVHTHADVAGGTGCQPTAKNAGAEPANCFTCFDLSRIHISRVVC